MSESSISKKSGFFCLSLFFQLCFFLLSHPLHFSLFIFLFPYILRLLSFLSPLFITTSILLFALLSAVSHQDSHMGFLATSFQVVFDTLRPRTEDVDDIPPLEELEAYKIVFETYTFETGENENPFEEVPEVEVQIDSTQDFSGKIKIFPENPCEERENEGKEEREEVKELDPEPKKDEGLTKDEDPPTSESKTMEKETRDFRRFTDDSADENLSVSYYESESSPWSSPASFRRENSLGSSCGSMRKEKEWRRTLACKLFEERHNADGTEGMDSLWETYENSESKKLPKKISNKTKRGKKIEEEDEGDAQLCCLQALKFSAGKMNLGMGRPNLVKMTKALKGFGWLSRHGSRKVMR